MPEQPIWTKCLLIVNKKQAGEIEKSAYIIKISPNEVSPKEAAMDTLRDAFYTWFRTDAARKPFPDKNGVFKWTDAESHVPDEYLARYLIKRYKTGDSTSVIKTIAIALTDRHKAGSDLSGVTSIVIAVVDPNENLNSEE